MGTVIPRNESGPVTYEVVEAVKGGQVVEARAAGKIGVAALGSTTVLGVASKDANTQANITAATTGNTGLGFPFVDTSAGLVTPYVAVYDHETVPVTFSGAVAFGKRVKAAALGKVALWVSGTDAADLIIGTCVEPAGITAADQVGLVRLGR